jgi:hypothetical protein
MMDEFDEGEPGATGCRLLWWKEVRGNEPRYLLAPTDFSYIMVVADRGDYVLPWTAFYVEFAHQRQKRKRAYSTYWGTRKAEAAPRDGFVTPSTLG